MGGMILSIKGIWGGVDFELKGKWGGWGGCPHLKKSP